MKNYPLRLGFIQDFHFSVERVYLTNCEYKNEKQNFKGFVNKLHFSDIIIIVPHKINNKIKEKFIRKESDDIRLNSGKIIIASILRCAGRAEVRVETEVREGI
jgi:hypothetical protein